MSRNADPLGKRIELAEIRVENILGPYSAVLSPEILAARIVAAVVEEVGDVRA